MTTSTKYEEVVGVPCALSSYVVFEALGRAFGSAVTLHISKELLAVIPERVGIPIQVLVDQTLAPTEWFVEANGQRYGSIGC